ncbi:hypothetical protein LNV23_19065 [Paucibacter sp. DJ1R-11]|uniref:deoxynucleotide monophosphate kinase family protein n=1 Tax=Paucibacter sp. DJ1R-11 TaxID=2893556 RepID=UPI0021E3D118|nr:hypothetical protein [Paucibacter sp. DJ1R-11]MCV2365555.1 hypothetical protein [Paucibacter sp. DJ1R-11]
MNDHPTPTPKHSVHLIALTGAAGCGKDTAGQLLASIALASNLDATVTGFADPIRQMLAAIIPMEYMTDRALKEAPVPHIGYSYRALAQTLGTDYGRVLMPGLWVRLKEAQLYGAAAAQAPLTKPVVHIVTDVRFEDEAAWVRRHGGTLLRIHREAAVSVREHESEWAWPHLRADAEIDNNGTLLQLRERLALALVRTITKHNHPDRRAA